MIFISRLFLIVTPLASIFAQSDELNAVFADLIYDPTKSYSSGSAVVVSLEDGEIYTASQDVPAAADGSNGPNGANASTYWGDSASITQQFEENNPTFLTDLPSDIDTETLSTQVAALTTPSFISFTVTIQSSIGGDVLGAGTYEDNTTISLQAIPSNEGYLFSNWSGDASGNSNPLSILVDSDKFIVANFFEDSSDDDGDGLTNFQEVVTYGTNKSKSDSDNDGLSDSLEVEIGSNPNYSDLSLINYAKSLVTINPSAYDLFTKSEYEEAIEVAKKTARVEANKEFQGMFQNQDANSTPYPPGWFFMPERGWMWTDKKVFPWFHDANSSNWMYFKSGEEMPTFYHYGTKEWMTIGNKELKSVSNSGGQQGSQSTWNDKYTEWLKNPEPYGGIEVLEKIRKAKENGSTELEIGQLPPDYSLIYISDITPLSELTNLRKLSLFNTYKIKDIQPLSSLVNLTELTLTSNTISDISPIEKLTNLEILNLQECGITDDDLESLSSLPRLRELNLRENEILDPSPLAEFKSLKVLAFGGSGSINDQAALPGLAKLSNLQELDLVYFGWGSSADSIKLALEQTLSQTQITY